MGCPLAPSRVFGDLDACEVVLGSKRVPGANRGQTLAVLPTDVASARSVFEICPPKSIANRLFSDPSVGTESS